MKPVIQQESTGCGIACAAAIAGVSYQQARRLANRIGVYADDLKLWSETQHVQRLLRNLGVESGNKRQPFKSWQSLPECALLAIKWHMEKGRPYWHWVVFVRDQNQEYVINNPDSVILEIAFNYIITSICRTIVYYNYLK